MENHEAQMTEELDRLILQPAGTGELATAPSTLVFATADRLPRIEPDCIVVDLDGTLVRTDTFVLTLIESLRKNPLELPRLAAAFLHGRSSCKSLAAKLGRTDVTVLPYNEPLVAYLREQRNAGRRLILATGADISIGRNVAQHLGFFHEVIASTDGRNVTGDEKVSAIKERIGDTPFAYAGNSRADLKVWRRSQAAILVGTPPRWKRQLRDSGVSIEREIKALPFEWRLFSRCLRCHQWVKNLLVFVPLLLSHQLRNAHLAWQGLIAFLALSLCASALYIVNDLMDLQADRLHPRKRLRPLASGKLSIGAGLMLAAFAMGASCALSFTMAGSARLLLAAYAITSFSYSLKLKRLLFVDVVTLSMLYAFRVLYGGAAMDIRISVWTLAFSLFLFTSLATVKRLTELRKVNARQGGIEEYRGYKEVDATQLSSLASSAGYAAVLVLALYINSSEVQLLYRRPQGLWLLCPVLIYWISRLTLIANRGHMDDDPVAFTLKDRSTWVVAIVAGLILLLSS